MKAIKLGIIAFIFLASCGSNYEQESSSELDEAYEVLNSLEQELASTQKRLKDIEDYLYSKEFALINKNSLNTLNSHRGNEDVRVVNEFSSYGLESLNNEVILNKASEDDILLLPRNKIKEMLLEQILSPENQDSELDEEDNED